jgi:hypothetical protein
MIDIGALVMDGITSVGTPLSGMDGVLPCNGMATGDVTGGFKILTSIWGDVG